MSVYYNSLDVNAINMLRTTFHNRPAVQLENSSIQVTVLVDGGHVAEILDKTSGVNPLWIPPWTDEESVDFGDNAETRLLRGIMGHNVCLDLFGPPSEAEAAAGVVAHGEGGILPYEFEAADGGTICRCDLPSSQLRFERKIRLEGNCALFEEAVENLSVFDRPIGWTQHVTLGPPFLERGVTQFRAPVTASKGIGDTEPQDLEVYTSAECSSGFTAHLMDPQASLGWFVAWSPRLKVELGYFWDRADFPWLGIWEENHSRTHSPWNGRTMTRGMEFGISPFPETRRQMIERGTLFDTPCYRWIAAKDRLVARYYAEIGPVRDTMPSNE
jgi:hypothetical protein